MRTKTRIDWVYICVVDWVLCCLSRHIGWKMTWVHVGDEISVRFHIKIMISSHKCSSTLSQVPICIQSLKTLLPFSLILILWHIYTFIAQNYLKHFFKSDPLCTNYYREGLIKTKGGGVSKAQGDLHIYLGWWMHGRGGRSCPQASVDFFNKKYTVSMNSAVIWWLKTALMTLVHCKTMCTHNYLITQALMTVTRRYGIHM